MHGGDAYSETCLSIADGPPLISSVLDFEYHEYNASGDDYESVALVFALLLSLLACDNAPAERASTPTIISAGTLDPLVVVESMPFGPHETSSPDAVARFLALQPRELQPTLQPQCDDWSGIGCVLMQPMSFDIVGHQHPALEDTEAPTSTTIDTFEIVFDTQTSDLTLSPQQWTDLSPTTTVAELKSLIANKTKHALLSRLLEVFVHDAFGRKRYLQDTDSLFKADVSGKLLHVVIQGATGGLKGGMPKRDRDLGGRPSTACGICTGCKGKRACKNPISAATTEPEPKSGFSHHDGGHFIGYDDDDLLQAAYNQADQELPARWDSSSSDPSDDDECRPSKRKTERDDKPHYRTPIRNKYVLRRRDPEYDYMEEKKQDARLQTPDAKSRLIYKLTKCVAFFCNRRDAFFLNKNYTQAHGLSGRLHRNRPNHTSDEVSEEGEEEEVDSIEDSDDDLFAAARREGVAPPPARRRGGVAAPPIPKAPAKRRTSKLQKLSRYMHGQLKHAATLRQEGCPNQADAIHKKSAAQSAMNHEAAVSGQRISRAAAELEELLFTSNGGLTRLGSVLNNFLDRPAVRELRLASSSSSAESGRAPYQSKDEQAKEILVKNAREFLTELMKTKGTRLAEDQNALDACLALMMGKNVDEKRLGAALERVVGITRRQRVRGRKLNATMHDKDSHWVRLNRAAYINAIGDDVIAILSDWLHSDEASIEDNNNKKPVDIPLGANSNGGILYCQHFPRMLEGTFADLFDKLTGRDRFDKTYVGQPTAAWLRVLEMTKTKKRPKGIKGKFAPLYSYSPRS